jgi:predicted molibdopterin-dependent oxidoreductase YjgC
VHVIDIVIVTARLFFQLHIHTHPHFLVTPIPCMLCVVCVRACGLVGS